jgi:hypothetical protein
MAALVPEVTRHRVPHDPETEKSYLRHPVLPRTAKRLCQYLYAP